MPTATELRKLQEAARNRTAKGHQFKPPQLKKEGPKGKYVGKEKYGGLTANAPKGKYKGKYIGPDRFKGDAEAYRKYKTEKRAAKLGPNYKAWLAKSKKAKQEGKAIVGGWASEGNNKIPIK